MVNGRHICLAISMAFFINGVINAAFAQSVPVPFKCPPNAMCATPLKPIDKVQPDPSSACNIQVTMSGPGRTSPEDMKATLSCLWPAYSNCNAAQLKVYKGGIDTSTEYTFTFAKVGNNCSIHMTKDLRMASGNRSSHLGDYTCTGLQKTPGGLIVQACGDQGDIAIEPQK